LTSILLLVIRSVILLVNWCFFDTILDEFLALFFWDFIPCLQLKVLVILLVICLSKNVAESGKKRKKLTSAK